VQHYAGTLATQPYRVSPVRSVGRAIAEHARLRPASLTRPPYYTSGYTYSARRNRRLISLFWPVLCSLVPTNLNCDAYHPSNVNSFISVDMHGESRSPTIHALYCVLNVADSQGPRRCDHLWLLSYNPVARGQGILGRVPRRRQKVDFMP